MRHPSAASPWAPGLKARARAAVEIAASIVQLLGLTKHDNGSEDQTTRKVTEMATLSLIETYAAQQKPNKAQ